MYKYDNNKFRIFIHLQLSFSHNGREAVGYDEQDICIVEYIHHRLCCYIWRIKS